MDDNYRYRDNRDYRDNDKKFLYRDYRGYRDKDENSLYCEMFLLKYFKK